MTGVILNSKELTPEQGNVLSEFDMYNGNPYFALSVQICSAAFHSHPYGHETIGYREDIETYTPEKLERFYRNYYRPDNAVMMVIGDVPLKTALVNVKKHFGHIPCPKTPIVRHTVKEPVQEGVRRVTIERSTTTNIVGLGFKHEGVATKEWVAAQLLGEILTGGSQSLLHTTLVDTGKASSVSFEIEPTREENIGTLFITIPQRESHHDIEILTIDLIRSLSVKDISNRLKQVKAKTLTEELFNRTHSRNIAQELTEYVAAGDWRLYTESPKRIESITAKEVHAAAQKLFAIDQMTIGYFKSKEK
jgi:zinc protease